MKKLQTKVFITLIIILTLSLLSFIIIFNIQTYNRELRMIKDNLSHINNKDNMIFMDANIYTIELTGNSIENIRNNSNNNISHKDIESITKNILKTNKNENIGNLYLNRYSYKIHNNILVISDNSMIQNRLRYNLFLSIIILIILESLIIIISKIITNLIIKPVKLSFQKQKEFIADASHELKTPLSVIISSSEALLDNPKDLKWVTNIKNEADRMNLLISDLLELSKSDSVIPVLSNGNISKLIELSVLTFEAKIYENHLKLQDNIENNIFMNMNDNNIKQLIEILLDNAIKHKSIQK